MAETEETTPKEEEEPKEPKTPPEEEEFTPPIRSGAEKEEKPIEQEPEEKKFWYALRQLGKEIKGIKEAVGAGETGEDFDRKKEEPAYDEVIDDIDKRNAAVLAEIDKKERVREVRDFLREHSEFKENSSKIEKTALHPKFWDISVDFIAKGYAFDEAQKMGAQKGRQADEEAAKSKIGGSPFKPGKKGEKDYQGMSDEEFDKEVSKAKRSD